MTLRSVATSPALPSGPDPVLQAALAELLQLGLVVARVAARLAEVEGPAVEVLAEAAVEAARCVAGVPGSLAGAIAAGQAADVSDAARDAAVARMASITDSFDTAARAVRRTAALQARLAEARPFRGPNAADGRAVGVVRGMAGRAANDAERPERMDDAELGNEIGGRADEDVLRDICRDLGLAAGGESRVAAALPEAARAVCARVGRPMVGAAGLELGDEGGAPPVPDT